MMYGERILARSLSSGAIPDKFGNVWQYHSRSDRHSKVGCWGVLFDLMLACPLLRSHTEHNTVAFGINHEMTDFVSGRRKNLDLVICLPRGDASSHQQVTFGDLISQYDIQLTSLELEAFNSLPKLARKPVGEVLVALESKACMTAHTKAAPRLFDELSSAAQCINGSAPSAIAVGHVLVNTSDHFVSSDRNRIHRSATNRVDSHDPQPQSAEKALGTARRLTVRGYSTERGFDAVGVTMLNGANDGTPYIIPPGPPCLPSNDPLSYEMMIHRLSGLYDTRFQNR
jgi:hypothetical protein